MLEEKAMTINGTFDEWSVIHGAIIFMLDKKLLSQPSKMCVLPLMQRLTDALELRASTQKEIMEISPLRLV
jgi:hypothetical protein